MKGVVYLELGGRSPRMQDLIPDHYNTDISLEVSSNF